MSKSARESLIFGLRPRQKVKQKQQCQRPEEWEANVCQDTRSPGGEAKSNRKACRKDSARGSHVSAGTMSVIPPTTMAAPTTIMAPRIQLRIPLSTAFPIAYPPAGQVKTRTIPGTRSSKSVT